MSGEIGWITEEAADAYFGTRYGAAEYWASGTDKEGALATAYNMLNGCGRFSFPTEATTAMRVAQCEQALFIVQQGKALDLRASLRAQGVRKADEVGETYAAEDAAMPISPRAAAFLKDYVKTAGGAFYSATIDREPTEDTDSL